MINWSLIIKFIKFGIVGGISFVIDFGVTYFCKERLKINRFVANTIGFIISLMFNYNLNRVWTFKVSHNQEQFFKFLMVATVGLIINNAIIFVLNRKVRMNFYLSKLIAVFIVMFYNFTMNHLITFAK